MIYSFAPAPTTRIDTISYPSGTMPLQALSTRVRLHADRVPWGSFDCCSHRMKSGTCHRLVVADP